MWKIPFHSCMLVVWLGVISNVGIVNGIRRSLLQIPFIRAPANSNLLRIPNTSSQSQSATGATGERTDEFAFHLTEVTNSSLLKLYDTSSVRYEREARILPHYTSQALGNGTFPGVPEPINGEFGSTDIGPRNELLEAQNPDIISPPSTDIGSVMQLTYEFSYSHQRLQRGGWSREVTQRELPVATTMAGVNMRLTPGGIRELHWHNQAEWGLVLSGSVRITAVDQNGRNFAADVGVGEIWYFPSGIPHSIQGLRDGGEFLLVFNSGAFTEENTFLLSDWLAQSPKSVLAKNFRVNESVFEHLPTKELYIFQGDIPGPLKNDSVSDPYGAVPLPYKHNLLVQTPVLTNWGSVRVVDSRNFPIAKEIAAALVEIVPNGMRELHWHPLADEWQYYISGVGRMTAFASGKNSRTFNVRAGTVGYIPRSFGYYIENIGNTTLRYLEMFASNLYSDISLSQWLALTPRRLVQEHLHLSEEGIQMLNLWITRTPLTGKVQ